MILLLEEDLFMEWTKPIPVEKKNIKVGHEYYSCHYGGIIKITILKTLKNDAVLVKVKSDKQRPFVRDIKYIFDNTNMARSAMRNWEHDERIRKNKK